MYQVISKMRYANSYNYISSSTLLLCKYVFYKTGFVSQKYMSILIHAIKNKHDAKKACKIIDIHNQIYVSLRH